MLQTCFESLTFKLDFFSDLFLPLVLKIADFETPVSVLYVCDIVSFGPSFYAYAFCFQELETTFSNKMALKHQYQNIMTMLWLTISAVGLWKEQKVQWTLHLWLFAQFDEAENLESEMPD